MNALQGVAFEKNMVPITGKRQINAPQPFVQKLDTELYPEGWEEGLTPDEFLTAAKRMLWKKFNDKNKIP